MPVPDDMDGHVLDEIFESTYAQPLVIRRASGQGPATEVDADSGYSLEDVEMVSERLKALGYME